MRDTYIIETRKGAAGIVVHDGRGFRFFAAAHEFNSLEGQVFSTPRQAEAAALRLLNSTKTSGSSPHRFDHSSQWSNRDRRETELGGLANADCYKFSNSAVER